MEDCRAERSCVRVLLSALGSLMLLGLGARAWAQSEQYPHTAENPAPLYWYRNVDGVGPQAGAMDPRLREISDAFGRGEFGVSRRLAEALVSDLEAQPALRAEAAAYVAESYLAQGEFEKARQTAKELEDAETGARAASVNRGYSDALSRLDLTLARTEAERAALAFRRARVHREAGCLALTQEAYWGLINEQPDSPQAVRAASEIVRMHKAYGTAESLRDVCETLVGLDPSSDVAVAACHAIGESETAWQKGDLEVVIGILRGIAEDRPNTRAGAASWLNIGELLTASERYEEAEAVWGRLVDANVDEGVSQEARYRLAELRYTMGISAILGKDWLEAVRWLEPVIPDLDSVGVATASGRAVDAGDRRVVSRRHHAVLSLGEAYFALGEWERAASAFQLVAVPGGPAEEIALFQLGRAKMAAGQQADAIDAFTRLRTRYPESALVAQSEGYTRTIQEQRRKEQVPAT